MSKPVFAAIRAARGEDSPTLSTLHAQGFDRAWGISDFEALIADRSVMGHVACIRSARPIGFVLSRMAADEAEILSIVIDRGKRGQGHAQRLLAQHLDDILRQRIRKMFLEVEAENRPAIGLYRGFGFIEVGRRSSYYRKADGSSADAIVMRKDL
jgi:[ribosomal protein S18]-alanine N-acetyltransferase